MIHFVPFEHTAFVLLYAARALHCVYIVMRHYTGSLSCLIYYSFMMCDNLKHVFRQRLFMLYRKMASYQMGFWVSLAMQCLHIVKFFYLVHVHELGKSFTAESEIGNSRYFSEKHHSLSDYIQVWDSLFECLLLMIFSTREHRSASKCSKERT